MIPYEIMNFIEDNIDLDQKELISSIHSHFKDKCSNDEADCLCKAIEHTINLYKEFDTEEITSTTHQSLMKALENSCKKLDN